MQSDGVRRRSAALELTVLTVVVMTALLAASSWLMLRWHRHWLMDEARRGLLLTSDTLEASLRYTMMRNHREEIHATIDQITRQTRVRRIRIIEHRGRVTVSTSEQDAGQRLQYRDPPCALCHDNQGKRPALPARVEARTEIGAGELRAFTPILAQSGCINQSCHRLEERSGVLGVMDLSLPLEEVERGLARTRLWSVTLSVASVLAGAIVLWAVLGRRFRRPMRDLLAGIRRVAAGDLGHRVSGRSNDEFGELAQSFNTMTQQLAAAQQSLIQSERLISMGKLAAGVAHEINNPLTGILSYAEDLVERAKPSDPRRKDYEVILNQALRCRRIVRSLLDFARQDAPKLAASDVGGLIDRAVEVVAKQAAFRDIVIERQLEPDLPVIYVDRVQIEQVLLNLILNAQQAMPSGGRIVLGARRDGKDRVELTVRDSGTGIPPEIRPRIFEPFFSTKGGRTDGLGLAVCLGIVQQHGGTIEAESEPGKGATFRVTLPLAQTGPSTEEEGKTHA